MRVGSRRSIFVDSQDPRTEEYKAQVILQEWRTRKSELRVKILRYQRHVLKTIYDSYEKDLLRQSGEKDFCDEMKRWHMAITMLDETSLSYFYGSTGNENAERTVISIQGGFVNDEDPIYISFRNDHWHEWGLVKSIFHSLEKICRAYFIQYATIDVLILTTLLQYPHLLRCLLRPKYLLPCFANRRHVQSMLKFPGQRYIDRIPYSQESGFRVDYATNLAATIIQAKWRQYHTQRIFNQILPYIKAQKWITKTWRRKIGRNALRAAKKKIWSCHEERALVHREAWKNRLIRIVPNPMTIVWIPSFGMNGEFSAISDAPENYSLNELLPKLLELRDPKISMIVILPRALHSNCWDFAQKHLGLSKNDLENRLSVMIPENTRFFLYRASTMAMVHGSPILQKKLRLHLKDQFAYLLSERVSIADFIVSSTLQRPLLGTTAEQLRKYQSPKNWNGIAGDCGFKVLPGYQLEDRRYFFKEFAKIVVKHRFEYDTWFGYYQTSSWTYGMILDLTSIDWKPLILDEDQSHYELSTEEIGQFRSIVEQNAYILGPASCSSWDTFFTLGLSHPIWLQPLQVERALLKNLSVDPAYQASTRLIGYHFYCDFITEKCIFYGSTETLGSRYLEPIYTVSPQQSISHENFYPKLKAMAERYLADGYYGHLSITVTLSKPSESKCTENKKHEDAEIYVNFVQLYYTKEAGIAQWLPLLSRTELCEKRGIAEMDVTKATEPDIRFMKFVRFIDMEQLHRDRKMEQRVMLWSDCLYHSNAGTHSPIIFESLCHTAGIQLHPQIRTGSYVLPRQENSMKTPVISIASNYRLALEEWVSCIPKMASVLNFKGIIAESNFENICKWAIMNQNMKRINRRTIYECKTLTDLCLAFVENPSVRLALENVQCLQPIANDSKFLYPSSEDLYKNPFSQIQDPSQRKLKFVAHFIASDIVKECVEAALAKYSDDIPPLDEKTLLMYEQQRKIFGEKTTRAFRGITIINDGHLEEDDDYDHDIEGISSKNRDLLKQKAVEANSAVKTLKKLFQTAHVEAHIQNETEMTIERRDRRLRFENDPINNSKPPEQGKQSRHPPIAK